MTTTSERQRTGLYPDGSPHPPPELRRRVLVELLVIILAAFAYVGFIKHRPLGMDVGLALVAIALVWLFARESCERCWGEPSSPIFDRTRRSISLMLLATVPTTIVFFVFGGVYAYFTEHTLSAVVHRLFNPYFFVTLVLYVPWALLQQTLFQFYLMGRLRALFPFASPLLLSVMIGALYGAVHITDWRVVPVTFIGGVIWSYSYHRDRYVIPLALSHAILASTYYYWVLNHDLFKSLLASFGL
jgi:membrane protease YdiL (CAAX protease family)